MVQVKPREKIITKTALVITVSNSISKFKKNNGSPRSLLILPEMVTQKQSQFPSFASVLSVLSIVFYGAGFLRVELKLNEQKKRIDALENNRQTEPRPSFEPSLVDIPKTSSLGKFVDLKSYLFTV